ncbi:hypothetical protein [Candidatus Uabimicrobium amorphum]|uniref:Uncharacterized protein n=1 Tax=Uabimicrobium amorphum TaxID=2596890 RepID=A0A5S9IJ65_UABAM|nr:hypothetical protein [Candidatus Uabimicrobium amorphum]BBM82361.1 hypothetical protein UABAM_00704 [Candidatus Uabimicrobium amorphum]
MKILKACRLTGKYAILQWVISITCGLFAALLSAAVCLGGLFSENLIHIKEVVIAFMVLAPLFVGLIAWWFFLLGYAYCYDIFQKYVNKERSEK